MTAGYNCCPVDVGSLRKYHKSWARLTRILDREGADPRISGMSFNAAVQAMLLFGLEMWVLTPHMEWSLGSFQHRVVRQITGSQPRRLGGRGRAYPPLTSHMEEAGFKNIGVYIQNRQNTVS